ncbi:MAG: class I SAM-dependent methyltransferase [bacterium]
MIEQGKKHILSMRMEVTYRYWVKKLRRIGNLTRDTSFAALDVGCGVGNFLERLEKWYPRAELNGIDIADESIILAGKKLNRTKLTTGDCSCLPYIDSCFDVVTAFQVIEHLKDPETFIIEARRVLKCGGIFAITTPNPEGICAQRLGNRWHGYIDDHISLNGISVWREMIENSGFEIRSDGTTGLTGYGIFRKTPLALINWIPMSICGYFPWRKGESYTVIAVKETKTGKNDLYS